MYIRTKNILIVIFDASLSRDILVAPNEEKIEWLNSYVRLSATYVLQYSIIHCFCKNISTYLINGGKWSTSWVHSDPVK